MSFNPLLKLRDNIEAIRIALAYQPGDVLSTDDTDALRKYAGFGGLKAVLYPAGEKQEAQQQAEGLTPAQVTAGDAHAKEQANGSLEEAFVVSLAGEKAHRDSQEKQIAGAGESTQPWNDETYRKAKGVRL